MRRPITVLIAATMLALLLALAITAALTGDRTPMPRPISFSVVLDSGATAGAAPAR